MTPHEFADLAAGFDQLKNSRFAGGAALATLVRTRGPVFRRAGARMLVHGDGRIVRGLSAGCPEADIAERAREVISAGKARLLCYDREHGYDALLELGCGGEMEVLLEPLKTADDLRYAEAAARCLQDRNEGTLMTVFAADGRCLPQPRRLLWSERLVLDELNDPRTADAVLSQSLSGATGATARLDEVATRSGRMQILVERLQPPVCLVLIGINTTTQALARLARGLGWSVRLIGHREDTPALELPIGTELLHSGAAQLSQRVVFDPRTAVVVMTHNLERDLDYLRVLRTQALAYLGAVGSRQRAAKMRDAVGRSRTPLHAPAGLDIGSETPEEIALAIAAEIQGSVNGRSGGRLSAGAGPIH
ncbi:MAG: XdhC family protein [Sinimarinibacterium sp.]|jgi:xanthine/CO dehydrogenase XdhC/CoxF family maturation factor